MAKRRHKKNNHDILIVGILVILIFAFYFKGNITTSIGIPTQTAQQYILSLNNNATLNLTFQPHNGARNATSGLIVLTGAKPNQTINFYLLTTSSSNISSTTFLADIYSNLVFNSTTNSSGGTSIMAGSTGLIYVVDLATGSHSNLISIPESYYVINQNVSINATPAAGGYQLNINVLDLQPYKNYTLQIENSSMGNLGYTNVEGGQFGTASHLFGGLKPNETVRVLVYNDTHLRGNVIALISLPMSQNVTTSSASTASTSSTTSPTTSLNSTSSSTSTTSSSTSVMTTVGSTNPGNGGLPSINWTNIWNGFVSWWNSIFG